MAPDREKRFLMRQRGAGTRQIRDVDFEIALPGTSRSPLKPVPSGRLRRTPQPKLLPQRSQRSTTKPTPLQLERSSKKTPRAKILRPQRSSRRTPTISQSQTEKVLSNSGAQQLTRSDGLGSTSRKRKLGDNVSISDLQRSTPVPEEVSTVPAGLQDGESIIAAEGAEVANSVPSLEESDYPVDSRSIEEVATQDEPPPSKKRRKRKRQPFTQASRKRTRRPFLDSAPQQSTTDLYDVQPSSISDGVKSEEIEEPYQDSSVPENIDLPEPLSETSSKAKRKRRKSIGKLPTSHQKLALATTEILSTPEEHLTAAMDGIEDAINRPELILESIERSDDDHLDTIEEADELESGIRVSKDHQGKRISLDTGPKLTRPRGRPIKSDLASQEKGKQNSVGYGAHQEAKVALSSGDMAPVSSTKLRKQLQKGQVSNHADGSIPITTHLLSKILGDDEEDDLAGPDPFPAKVGVNALDVLGQICREMIAKTMDEAANNRQSSGPRAEWRRRRKAIEMFWDELDSEIFQMSEAVDNSRALKSRLRKAKKEVKAATEELLDIRRERETIALQMDDVRMRHEVASRKSQKTNDLNNLLQDIELAVQRGRAVQSSGKDGATDQGNGKASLDFTLQQVAGKVSSVQGLGLLDQVKSFNLLLEKAVVSL